MMEPRLQNELGLLEATLRRERFWRRLTRCWLAAAAVCVLLFLIHKLVGWNSPLIWSLPLIGGVMAAVTVWAFESQRSENFPMLIATLEHDHPDLRHLLSTATEQRPNAESGNFHFLQLRVINEVLTHRQRYFWEENLRRRLNRAANLHAVVLIGFFCVLFFSSGFTRRTHSPSAPWLKNEITVTPGDTEVERGTGLVISARFGGRPPAEATLVLLSASGKTNRIALERHLADPIFGASLLEVTEDGLYHVEYAGKQTPDFKIKVFDYPALTRADAALEFPRYTGLTNKTIRDTLRVTAVEGSRLTYSLELNKPVVRARLVGKNSRATIPLTVQTNAIAMLDGLVLTNSARYSLELVDADGRTNKAPSDFSIQVLTNRRPELKLAFPRGDQRVSRLEELQLQAETSDDFGVLKYGMGFGVAGQEPQYVELGESTRANEKRSFTNLVAMEKLGVDVNQVVSYFAWADDYGPDGETRRTFSDMFFAEVRPFEEVFRADQSGAAESGNQNQRNQGQGQGQGGNQNTRLAELQKQIVIATWKLQRDKQGPKK
jgi:hypothetical protein